MHVGARVMRAVYSHMLLAATVALAQIPHSACAAPLHVAGVPELKHLALDARLGWHASRRLELSVTVRNLLGPGHVEWGAPASRVELERAAFVKLMWRL